MRFSLVLKPAATLVPGLIIAFFALNSHSAILATNPDFDAIRPYADFLNDVSDRRRRVVYIQGPAIRSYGVRHRFVYVGTGHLSFLRRDLVTISSIPLQVTRMYDSSKTSSKSFGIGGWVMAGEESISRKEGTDFLTYSRWYGPDFLLRKTDQGFSILNSRFTNIRTIIARENALIAMLKNGWQKRFEKIGDKYVLTGIQDNNQNKIQFIYSGELLVKMSSNSGRTIIIERDVKGRIIRVLDEQGREVSYNYDNAGRLVEVVDLGGNKWVYEYDHLNRLTAANTPEGTLDLAVIYSESGRVSDTFIHGWETKYFYRADGNKTRVVEEDGKTTEYWQNSSGTTHKVTNPLGVSTILSVDSERSAIALLRNNDEVARMFFDEKGKVEKLIRSKEGRQVTTVISYNNGLPVEISNATGDITIKMSYDDRGNNTQIVFGDRTISYELDVFGNLLKRTDGHSSIEFNYNKFGAPILVQPESKDRFALDYNPAGRLIQVQADSGLSRIYGFNTTGLRNSNKGRYGQVKFLYDSSGSLQGTRIVSTYGTTAKYDYVFDHLSRLIGMESSVSDPYKIVYGMNDAPENYVSPDGDLRFEYDGLDRLKAVTAQNGKVITYQYAAGESDVRRQADSYSKISLSDNSEFELFGPIIDVVFSRTNSPYFGPVFFDQFQKEFKLTWEDGVYLQNERYDRFVGKLRIDKLIGNDPQFFSEFDAPTNYFFIPPEFLSVNCCVCPPQSMN